MKSKLEQLNYEIKKNTNNAVRRNLNSVKMAIERNKKIVYLPEKNFVTMVKTVNILIDCTILVTFIPIKNGKRVGKIVL